MPITLRYKTEMRVSHLIDLLSKVHDSDAVVRIDGHDCIGVEVAQIDKIEKKWLRDQHRINAITEVRFVKMKDCRWPSLESMGERSAFSMAPRYWIPLQENR